LFHQPIQIIRGDNSINTGFFSEEIARLTKENFELRNKLSSGTTFSTPNEALYSGLTYDELDV
jgi:uncharacterized protein (UPF0332 family)